MPVHRTGKISTDCVITTNDFGNRRSFKVRISRVFTFRAESEEVVFSCSKPCRIQNREYVFACGCWMCCAFKYNKLARSQRLCDRMGRPFNIAEIWITAFVQWGRHTDNNAVRFSESAHVRRRFKLLSLNQFCNRRTVNVLNIALASLQLIDLRVIDIKADCMKARSNKRPDQGKAHVA